MLMFAPELNKSFAACHREPRRMEIVAEDRQKQESAFPRRRRFRSSWHCGVKKALGDEFGRPRIPGEAGVTTHGSGPLLNHHPVQSWIAGVRWTTCPGLTTPPGRTGRRTGWRYAVSTKHRQSIESSPQPRLLVTTDEGSPATSGG